MPHSTDVYSLYAVAAHGHKVRLRLGSSDSAWAYADVVPVSPGIPYGSPEERNRWMLRARDAIDRDYACPLNIPTLARIAAVSESHFIRTFRDTFGETPHRYLQRRRVERAMALLRNGDYSVTATCFAVGFSSLGTFSRTFRDIVGCSPSAFRQRVPNPMPVPTCFVKAWSRPSSFGEADQRASA
jgi:AraC-like DNA-binding protein